MSGCSTILSLSAGHQIAIFWELPSKLWYHCICLQLYNQLQQWPYQIDGLTINSAKLSKAQAAPNVWLYYWLAWLFPSNEQWLDPAMVYIIICMDCCIQVPNIKYWIVDRPTMNSMGQALISGSTVNQKYLCNVWLPLLKIWEAEPEGPEPNFWCNSSIHHFLRLYRICNWCNNFIISAMHQ